jgi:hypothetical protein
MERIESRASEKRRVDLAGGGQDSSGLAPLVASGTGSMSEAANDDAGVAKSVGRNSN